MTCSSNRGSRAATTSLRLRLSASLIALGAITCGSSGQPSWAMAKECHGADECRTRCEQDDADACAKLADLLFSGEHIPRDSTEAGRLWEKACEMGSDVGCDHLASHLLGDPEEVEPTIAALRQKAAELRAKRCEAHDLKACFGRVFDLQFGWDASTKAGKDPEAAFQLSERALPGAKKLCEGGDAEACYIAGRLTKGFADQPSAQSLKGALGYYESACKLDGERCVSFAMLLAETGDAVRSREVLSQRCDADEDGSACYPRETDPTLTKRWIEKRRAACAKGLRLACDDLGGHSSRKLLEGARSSDEARADHGAWTRLLDDECSRGEGLSCSDLAIHSSFDATGELTIGPALLQRYTALERACELGVPFTCTEASMQPLVRDAVAIYPSEFHSCVRRKDGRIGCWGVDGDGRLGVAEGSKAPLALSTLDGEPADGVTFQGSSCVLASDGRAYCWGVNPTKSSRAGSPAKVLVAEGATRISGGTAGLCVEGSDRRATCYGSFLAARSELKDIDRAYVLYDRFAVRRGNALEVQGRSEGDRPIRLPVAPAQGDWQVGLSGMCSLRKDGSVACAEVDLSHGDPKPQKVDLLVVPELRDAVEVSVLSQRACARTSDGHIRCWELPNKPPAEIAGVYDATSLRKACAATKRGFVFCWGGRYGVPWGVAEPMRAGPSNPETE